MWPCLAAQYSGHCPRILTSLLRSLHTTTVQAIDNLGANFRGTSEGIHDLGEFGHVGIPGHKTELLRRVHALHRDRGSFVFSIFFLPMLASSRTPLTYCSFFDFGTGFGAESGCARRRLGRLRGSPENLLYLVFLNVLASKLELVCTLICFLLKANNLSKDSFVGETKINSLNFGSFMFKSPIPCFTGRG